MEASLTYPIVVGFLGLVFVFLRGGSFWLLFVGVFSGCLGVFLVGSGFGDFCFCKVLWDLLVKDALRKNADVMV